MTPEIETLVRRLAMADRTLLAVEDAMAQAREAIETARKAIADAQAAACWTDLIGAGENARR